MELIDRRKLVSDFWKGVEDGSILSYEDTDDLMENASTVDAVEVVRCEKCRYCDQERHYCDHPMSTSIPIPRKPDDFCS